jgi:hypothetical protein
MSKPAPITMENSCNFIFIPAAWVVDARGGLRLASEADREPVVVARPSSARQNGQKKRSRHTCRPVKSVAAHSLHAVISKGP